MKDPTTKYGNTRDHYREHSLDVNARNKDKLVINTNREADKAETIGSRIVNTSKSPDKYILNNSLVVNLNDPNSVPN